ncbi:MAG TPA: DUF3775 domain-containing protein [Bauldia sp.]|nr:DUF3775 domain-containing protein [Bauldia sp.]
MPELDISVEKVAWVIVRAREYESKVAPFDDGDAETAEEEGAAILENRRDDATLNELTGFFRGLNDDEEANLVAIAWIGRGTYTAEEWDEALATARAERNTRTERYLLGMPLLADHLEAGLDALGISPMEAEADVT